MRVAHASLHKNFVGSLIEFFSTLSFARNKGYKLLNYDMIERTASITLILPLLTRYYKRTEEVFF